MDRARGFAFSLLLSLDEKERWNHVFLLSLLLLFIEDVSSESPSVEMTEFVSLFCLALSSERWSNEAGEDVIPLEATIDAEEEEDESVKGAATGSVDAGRLP